MMTLRTPKHHKALYRMLKDAGVSTEQSRAMRFWNYDRIDRHLCAMGLLPLQTCERDYLESLLLKFDDDGNMIS